MRRNKIQRTTCKKKAGAYRSRNVNLSASCEIECMYYCEGGLHLSGSTHYQIGKCIVMGLCDISWHKMKYQQLKVIRSSRVIITFIYLFPSLVLKRNKDTLLHKIKQLCNAALMSLFRLSPHSISHKNLRYSL